MKSAILFLLFAILIIGSPVTFNSDTIANSSTNQDTCNVSKNPFIVLTTTSFNADTAFINTPLNFNVFYKNIGEEPLIISKVRTSCSCTVASYSTAPLLKGETDKIVLKLDTGKPGTFIKSVAIYSNASNAYDETINSSRIVFKIKWVVVNKNLHSETKESSDKAK